MYLITQVDRKEFESILRTLKIFSATRFFGIHVITQQIQLLTQLSGRVLTHSTHFNSILSKFLSIPIPFRFFCHGNERNSFGVNTGKMN